MSDRNMPTESAQRAQDRVDGGDTNEYDKQAAQEEFDKSGEPRRDAQGNQDGSS